MAETSKTVPANIANALLALFLLFLGISAGLAAYIYVQHARTQAELTRLAEEAPRAKSRDQLQAELLTSDNRQALFPHADKRVGFIFSRHHASTSLYAADGDSFPINDLGLRGKPIGPKPSGTTRIAIVSDSWLFGWRLKDNDRLQSQLTALLWKHYPGKPYEVITVAVPGWNVENQAAFLEDHFDRLQPDVLIWSINSNDLWDTQSVIPPGIPATRPAPGADRICPDTGFEWTHTSAPIVIERWRRNVELMAGISKTYGVPILAMHVSEFEPYVSMIQKVSDAPFPIVSTPAEFINDPRWQLQLGIDTHPTFWASQIMAVDLLGHLIEYGHLPPAELSDYENDIVAKGKTASRHVSPERVEEFINSTHGLPSHYDRGAPFKDPAITANWEACPQGRISIGREKGTTAAEIAFDEIRNDKNGSNSLTCTVRTKEGRTYKGESFDRASVRICKVSMPPSPTPEILDLYWEFQKFTCTSEVDCFSARFVSARVF